MKIIPSLVIVAMIGLAGVGASQSQSRTEAQMTALTPAVDAMFARRILMSTIGVNNDNLHDTFDGVFEYESQEVKARLDAISAMLLAFPHLYREEPDLWSQEAEDADAAAVSLSLPLVWEDWENFNAMAVAASDTALRASNAFGEANQKALTDELEAQCEACHEMYRRTLTYVEAE